jgi:vacuolar-type H+-ATPase subunit E/Vma4
MALDRLVTALETEAEAEAQAILAKARAEASAIRERCEKELADRRDAARTDREAEQRATVELALVSVRRDARRIVLEARQRLLDRVLAAARTRFPETLRAPAYRSGLPGQLAQALGCLGGRKGVLEVHPLIADQLRASLGSGSSVELRSDAGAGSGFRLRSADGTLEVEATLESELARQAARVALEILRRQEISHDTLG